MIGSTLLLQVGTAVPTTPVDMIRQSTTMTKVVLVFLVVLSLLSWAVMLAKWRELRGVESAGREFLRHFSAVQGLNEASQIARTSPASPFTRVYAAAVNFVAGLAAPAYGGGGAGTLTGSQVEALRLLMDAKTTEERDRLGHYIPWLATIGSVSPLIGLLGTVLGVIDAFIGIAVRGSGNLSAVAPGVSEALIATAAALAVAIPAVFGYNFLATRLNRLDAALDRFGTEIIAMMSREGRI